jgi:hypothetical protein
MHAMNFFTLSFVKSPKLASGFADAVLKRLEIPDISDEYRKALEYKLMMSVTTSPVGPCVCVLGFHAPLTILTRRGIIFRGPTF